MNKQIAILISGRGSNMMAIHQALIQKNIPASIAFIGSDNLQAEGLVYAQKHHIPTYHLDYQQGKKAAEQELLAQLQHVSLLCLAGFMRILSAEFIAQAPCRIINIHPSLLPKFKGLNTHERALAAGETRHGCTIHEVTEKLDGGKILGQAAMNILADSDAASLADAVLMLEHQLYPDIISKLLMDEEP